MHPAAVRLSAVLLLIATLTSLPAPAKEMPLWEGIEKTPAMLKADQKFIEGLRKATNGELDQSAKHFIMRGWEAFAEKDYEVAVRRFNQAWLLDSENGAIYWGFALTTHLRGDDFAVVERWFLEAEKRLANVAELLSDHGRILEEHDRPEQAVAYLKRALALNPDQVETHINIMHAARKLGDEETVDFHRRQVERLRKGQAKQEN